MGTKMVKISAQNISEDSLQKYYMEYMSRGRNVDDGDNCEICNLPKLFHIDDRGEIILGPCDKYTTPEHIEIWKIFRQKIRPIRKWYKEILEKREEDKINYLKGFTTLTEDIMNGNKNLEDLQNYISKIGDIKIEANESQKVMEIVRLIISQFIETSSNDSELETDGRMSRTQSNESKPKGDNIEKDRKEQETYSKCSHCNKELNNLKDFEMHENKCHMVENESKEQEQQDHKWKCDLCEKQYECKDELKTHEKEHHESNESKPKGHNIENDRKEQEINSKCSHCNREFNNLKDLKKHENKCHVCEQGNNWYDNREDLESHKERRHKGYTCDQCGYYGSTNKKELDDHIKEWHAEYNCNQCENSYRLKGILESHIKEAHSKECEITLESRIEQQNYESECDLCKK